MTSTNKPVALVIGASRGIGRQIAIDLAKNGYAVVVAAKTTTPESDLVKLSPFPPNPNSPQSTITTVAREITVAGGEATAIPVDTTDYASIQQLIAQTIETYVRLDVLIYNSGAIWWAPVSATPMKRFQLMQRVNVEGLYGTVQEALPHLKRDDGKGAGSLFRFFRGKTAYAMGKVGMSVLTKGLGMDFEREGLVKKGMAVTSVWPAAAIESAATEQFTRKDPTYAKDLRKPTIFSDAIIAILNAPASVVNGQLELDEDFLRKHAGVTDFSKYAVVQGASPRRIMPAELPGLTVKEQDDEGMRTDSSKL
ncbi:Hydroxysteroid dehydrogenase-like protein 2 [Madurella mycetomatis]|uniref:Hydroxysteroid dehydrogenase-like protein 2 n=1 Tax=Madurella mycetomatis TaxID=100816 RepID=A0A175WFD3_9PEZI|nr:Hydroxysteroid dehydrogenase-like protein 2 [Madurella mycetomatis]